jgi:thiol-disulfide isomerase/thioredoxin
VFGVPSIYSGKYFCLAVYRQRNTAWQWFASILVMVTASQRKALNDLVTTTDLLLCKCRSKLVGRSNLPIDGGSSWFFDSGLQLTVDVSQIAVKKKQAIMILMNTAWILIASIALDAFQQEVPYTTISGKLIDYKNETITLIPVEEYFPSLEPTNKMLLTAKTDSLGYFVFRSDKIKSGFYQIIHRNYHRLNYDIYMNVGDSLYIEQAWESQLFNVSGKGADKLQHLVRDHKRLIKDKKYYDSIENASFKTELLYKSFVDSLYDRRIRTLMSDQTVSKQLKSHFLNGLYADKANTLLYHLERRNYITQGQFTYFYPDQTYYAFFDELKLDDAFCLSSNAKVLARNYLTNKARVAFKDKEEEVWWEEHLEWRLNYVMNHTPSSWNDLLIMGMLSEYSFGMLNENFFQDIAGFDEKANTLFKHKSNQDLYQQNALAFLNLAPGKPAPDFALPDSSGNILKLSDYKGKIVYVDVWGTWCGPCIEEIPDALKLQEAYDGKPIVFLYVALEYGKNDIARWRSFIAGKNKRFLDKPFTILK